MTGLDIFSYQFDIRKEAIATHHALLLIGKKYFPTVPVNVGKLLSLSSCASGYSGDKKVSGWKEFFFSGTSLHSL